MTWEEDKHPRDNEGRFTFKNGSESNSPSPAQILYGKATKEQKEKQSIKDKLLSILGNKATPADILYGDEKSLTEKIKDYGLEKFYTTGIRFNKLSGNIARKQLNNLKGTDAVGMLDIASGKKNLEYSKNAIKLNNIDVFKEKSELYKFKPYMKNKIQEQFKDFNYDINNIKGYVFEKDSPQVQRIKESQGFKEIIKQNKNNILNNREKISGRFFEDKQDKNNMHNAFASVDFLNLGIDKDNNLRLYMFDTYDFNENESPKIEAGRKEMFNGTLKGFFSLHEIVLTKKELNEIFR